MQRKVLVTGGAGYIGFNLAKKLIQDGENVTIWDNLSTGQNVHPKANFKNVSITTVVPEEKFDVIFHLAAQSRIPPSFDTPVETCKVNILGTLNVLDFARRHNSKVVYAGSSSFYGDLYANPYAFSKWGGEECCKLYNSAYGLDVSIARFFNVYGGEKQIEEGSHATVIGIFERQKRLGLPLTVTGDGSKRRDFIYVQDIVRALDLMSRHEGRGQIYNLGTGSNYSILEVAQMFSSNIEFIPDRPGEATSTCADTYLAQQELGWNCSMDLKCYIESLHN